MTWSPLSPPARVAIAGDWHGNTHYARYAVAHAAHRGAQVILHTGDFAAEFAPFYLAHLTAVLADHDMRLLFVDGNHDDHHYLARLPLDHEGLRPVTARIWHVPRGFRWTWHGIRFLALGGAHSVNRQERNIIPGYNWWPEERLTLAECARAVTGGQVDVMVCHDCPAGVDIPGLEDDAGRWPAAEIATAEQHRAVLRTVVDQVQPGALWHGHYHRRYSAVLPLHHPVWGRRVCRIEGLHRDGVHKPYNTWVGSVHELLGSCRGAQATAAR